MIKIILKHRIFRQIIKFALVGVVNTLIDLAVYYALTRWLGMHYLWANTLAIIVAMTSSFVGNKFFTFRNASLQYLRQYTKVAIINLSGLAFSNFMVYTLVEHLHIYDIYAKIITILLVALANFVLLKYWAFASELEDIHPQIIITNVEK